MVKLIITALLALVWLPNSALAEHGDCDTYANDNGQIITFTGKGEYGHENFTLNGQRYRIMTTKTDEFGVYLVAWPVPIKDGGYEITIGGSVLQLGTEIFECADD